MIDTIRIAYPLDGYLRAFFKEKSEKIVRLSPDGEVMWEKAFMRECLPSHFSGLGVFLFDYADAASAGFNLDWPKIIFEFSLQKWQSETGYNNKNTDIVFDMVKLNEWINSLCEVFEYDFEFEKFVPMRVDLAQNFILENGSVDDYLRSLEIKFSRSQNAELKNHRYPGAIHYGSDWLSKKIYSKHKEFMDVERRKHKKLYQLRLVEKDKGGDIDMNGKRPLTKGELDELIRMLRFEVGFKRKLLKKCSVENLTSIPDLLLRFEEEKKKYLTIQNITGELKLSPAEYLVVDLCKRMGESNAKNEFCKERTDRTWYRIKRQLQAKNIYVNCLVNSEWRLDVESADNLKDFKLRLAS